MLRPSIIVWSDILPNLDNNGCDDGRQANTAEAVRLLLSIVEYASQETFNDSTCPWHRGSKFLSLRLNLEKFSISVSENFDLDPRALKPTVEDSTELAVSALMTLLRDCCGILLNRNFLPLPRHRRQYQENHEDRLEPPRVFIEGRINACEACAESIYELCTIFISNEIFFLVSRTLHEFTAFTDKQGFPSASIFRLLLLPGSSCFPEQPGALRRRVSTRRIR